MFQHLHPPSFQCYPYVIHHHHHHHHQRPKQTHDKSEWAGNKTEIPDFSTRPVPLSQAPDVQTDPPVPHSHEGQTLPVPGTKPGYSLRGHQVHVDVTQAYYQGVI